MWCTSGDVINFIWPYTSAKVGEKTSCEPFKWPIQIAADDKVCDNSFFIMMGHMTLNFMPVDNLYEISIHIWFLKAGAKYENAVC